MKIRLPYNIRKALLCVTIVVTMYACNKEPYKEMVIDWDWSNPPDKELIKQYANDKDVKTIVLNLLPYSSGGFNPAGFHRARDTLALNYFSISPENTIGRGTIYVNEFNGAQLPDPYATDIHGMSLPDSIWYTGKHFKIARGAPPINKSR